MKSTKIITHLELLVAPEFLAEVIPQAARTRDSILLEEGCESFLLMTKDGEPATLVVFAVYASRQAYDWHLDQDYIKTFFAFLQGKLLAAPKASELTEI